jgi:hypothetical protein
MIPEVHACSGYLVITPKRAYRDNAGALIGKERRRQPLPLGYLRPDCDF